MRAALLLLLLAAASVSVDASAGIDSSFTYLFNTNLSTDSTLENVLATFSYCQNLVGDGSTDIKVTLELDQSSFSDPINPSENLVGVAFQLNLGGSPLAGLQITNITTGVFCQNCTLSTYTPVVCLKSNPTCKTAAGVGPWFPLKPTTTGYYDVEMKLTQPSYGKVQKVSFIMSYPGKSLDALTLNSTNWYFRFQETDGIIGGSSKMGGPLPATLPGCIKVKSIAGNCYGQSYGWTADKTRTSSSPMASNTTADFNVTATKSSATTTHLTLGGIVSIQNNAGSAQTIQSVKVKLVKFCDDTATGTTQYDITSIDGTPLPDTLANGGVVDLQYDAAVNLASVDLQCPVAPPTGRKLLAKRPKRKHPEKKKNLANTSTLLNSIASYPSYQVVVDVIVGDSLATSYPVRDISAAFTLPSTPDTWFDSTTMTDTLTLPTNLTCGALSIDGVAQTSCPSPTLFSQSGISSTTTKVASLTLLNAGSTELVANNAVQLAFTDVAPVAINLVSLDPSITTPLTNSISCVDTPTASDSDTVAVSPVPADVPPPSSHTNCTNCCTYTLGGYGNNGAPGKKLVNWYNTYKKPDPVVVGDNPYITLTNATAIQTMLKINDQGTPGSLNGSLTDPTDSLGGAGIYAKQVVTLWLNLNIGATDSPSTSIGGLLYCPTSGVLSYLKGKTVAYILTLAEGVLSQGVPAGTVPSQTVSDWNDLVTQLNQSYDNCVYSAGDGQFLYVGTACP